MPESRRLTAEIREFLAERRFDIASPPPRDDAWPGITVITPSMNQARFLERTLISVHNQGYPNVEHIVIDGGSADGSARILERYDAVLAYWHSRPDRGQSSAINQGAERATRPYMTWLNSDDLLLPGALKALGEAIRSSGDLDLVYGHQVEVDEKDRVLKRVYSAPFDLRSFLAEVSITVHNQSAVWKTGLFRSIGGLRDFKYAMDYDMIYRMAKVGMRTVRIDRFVSGFRLHPASLTGSGELRRARWAEVDAVFEEHYGRARTPFERTAVRAFYKGRRLLAEPRALLAAAEHRTSQAMSLLTSTQGKNLSI